MGDGRKKIQTENYEKHLVFSSLLALLAPSNARNKQKNETTKILAIKKNAKTWTFRTINEYVAGVGKPICEGRRKLKGGWIKSTGLATGWYTTRDAPFGTEPSRSVSKHRVPTTCLPETFSDPWHAECPRKKNQKQQMSGNMTEKRMRKNRAMDKKCVLIYFSFVLC